MELQNLEGTKKKVMELENENSNYQNELLDLHKCLVEISNTLGSINLEQAKLKQGLE
jgi:wobble nucleotide-excising tRNase